MPIGNTGQRQRGPAYLSFTSTGTAMSGGVAVSVMNGTVSSVDANLLIDTANGGYLDLRGFRNVEIWGKLANVTGTWTAATRCNENVAHADAIALTLDDGSTAADTMEKLYTGTVNGLLQVLCNGTAAPANVAEIHIIAHP